MKTKKIFLGLLLIITACSGIQKKSVNEIKGNWGFLDKYGNYNEAWFGDSTFKTVNRFLHKSPVILYTVKNDSLMTNAKTRTSELTPVAAIIWLSPDSMVIDANFVTDTLIRIKYGEHLLGNTDPVGDSVIFWPDFYDRYEDFLVEKGIITRKEAEEFRKNKVVPEDVLKQEKQQDSDSN